MKISKFNIGGTFVWMVVVEQFSQNNGEIIGYTSYFNFKEPDLFLGQQIKDDSNVKIFKNEEDAIEYTKNQLKNIHIIHKHPLNYNIEEISKLVFVPIKITVKIKNETRKNRGEIIRVSSTNVSESKPYKIHFFDVDSQKELSFSIFDIEQFESIL